VYNKLDSYLLHLLAGVVLEYPFKLKEPATYQFYNTNLPLEGYGGTSMLLIEGASVIEGDSLSDQKYWLNFTGIEPSRCQIQKIVIKNVGPVYF
jgi:hypothetical protein